MLGADITQFRLKESKLKACEISQENLATLLFQKGYMSNGGQIEWRNLKSDIDDAVKKIDEREGE